MARLPNPANIQRSIPRITRGLPQSSGALPGIRRAAAAVSRDASLAGGELEAQAKMLAQLSQTSQNVANIFAEQEARRQAARDKLSLAQAKSQFLSADINARNAFEGDPDHSTYVERYREIISKTHSEISETLPPHIRGFFEADTLPDIERGAAAVYGKARVQERDSGKASLYDLLDSNMEAALRAQDEQSRLDILNASSEAIEGGILSGYITEVEGQRLRETSAEDFAAARFAILPPAQRLQALQEGMAVGEDGQPVFRDTNTSVDFIPTDKRALMIEKARDEVESQKRQRLLDLERAERLSDKRTKAAQEEAEGLFTNRIFDPEDSVSDEEIRLAGEQRLITASQVTRLINLNRSEADVSDDPNVMLNIYRDALAGDDSVPDRIVTAMENGLLSDESAKSIYNTFDQAERRGGILARDDVQRAREYIDSIIGGVRGPLATLDSAESARVANATRDFDVTIQQLHEQGKQFSAQSIAEELVERYRTVPQQIDALARPMFLIGSRNKPDIEATRQATLDALDAGEIDESTATEELTLLEEIESLVDAR